MGLAVLVVNAGSSSLKLALLGGGETGAAAARASDLVALNPYDENAHVLLVRLTDR